MLLKEVIGQNKVKNSLRRMIANQRIPHASLFLGNSGSGVLALAIAFGQYLLCENPSESDACGICSSCKKAQKLIHPDLHFSYPTIGRNVVSDQFAAEWRKVINQNPYLSINDWLLEIGDAKSNLQGNINKEECLNITKKLGLKSFENDRKVMIIWMAEYLQKEGNRLLKIIEEPPKDTFFILVAENQEAILNTILSRCQLIKVPALSESDIIEGLQQDGIPKDKSTVIATLADGDFNAARSMSNEKQDANPEVFVDWMRKCYIGNGVELVRWSEQMAQYNKQSQKYFLQYGLHYIRELVLMNATGIPSVRLGEKERATAQKMQSIINIEQAEMISGLLSDCYYGLERNGNAKILFLDASIQTHKVMRQVLEKIGV